MVPSGGEYPLEALPQVLDKVKALGYDGIEMPVAHAMMYGSARFAALMTEKGLEWIGQIFSCGAAPTPGNLGVASDYGIEHPADSKNAHDVETHKKVWAGQVLEAAKLGGILRSVTSHTGKDWFTPAEASDMLAFCVKFAAEHKVKVYHETHRGRILYSPWTTPAHVAAHAGIRLVADLSHFTVVAELGTSNTELNSVIEGLAPHVSHVHARVGFEEGPQVPDPRGPRWAPYLGGFKVWWQRIFEEADKEGMDVITVTPEFGPPLYAWTDPFTDKPLANMWDVNHYVGQQVQELYTKRFGAAASGKLVPDSGAQSS